MTPEVDEARCQALLARLYEADTVGISVDTETTGLQVRIGTDYCIGVSIAGMFEDGEPFSEYLPFAHPTGTNFSQETRDMLEWVLFRQGRMLDFANVQFDILSLGTLGWADLDMVEFFDVIQMAHLIDENTPKSKSLDSLAKHYLDQEKISDPYVDSEKLTGNQNITPEDEAPYARRDAELTWQLRELFVEHPVWTALPAEVWESKQELARMLIEMKRRGVRIDTELSMSMIEQGEQEMKRLGREMGYPGVPKKPTKMYPHPDQDPLPVIGPNVMEDLFIKRLELPVIKRGKPTPTRPEGRPSFDKDVMAEYDLILERLENPLAKLVKAYRGWQKAVSAAYRPYLELLDQDGRLGCSYKMHGTKTGRLSCEKPNLQQIPKVTDKPWNGRVKECFIPRDGYVLLNADFSQLELRLATAYAGEKDLAQVFLEGRDIFTEMSAQLGMARHDTKTLVYSMQYGAGLNRLMNAFGISKTRAQEVRNNYFATYPLFKILGSRIAATAEQTMQARLWSGRYRHLEFKSEAFKAMNSVIQGGAADIVERVMVRCFRELDNEDCRALLQVHDSLTWEVKIDHAPYYMDKIRDLMQDVPGAVGHDDFGVFFAVDVGFWTDREEQRYADWKATQ